MLDKFRALSYDMTTLRPDIYCHLLLMGLLPVEESSLLHRATETEIWLLDQASKRLSGRPGYVLMVSIGNL